MKRWRAPQVVITEVMSLHQLCCMQTALLTVVSMETLLCDIHVEINVFKMETVFESNNLVFADIV